MAQVIAFLVVMLFAIAAFEATLGLSLALLIYGPGAYAAIVAGWCAAHVGVELPWAISIGLTTGVAVRALTIWFLRLLAETLSPLRDC